MLNQPLRIVFLDSETLGPHTQLQAFSFPHELVCYEKSTEAQAIERCKTADIIISNKAPVSPAVIEAATSLKLVAIAATGYNNVALDTCKNRNIVVCNVRNYAEHTVPEHTLALIFALRRSLLAYHQSVARGRWQESQQFCYFDYPIRDLAGSTLGIIGSGALGQSVAKLAQGLGMTVQFAARKGSNDVSDGKVSFEHMLRTSDIISLHCPLTPETANLLTAKEFAMMDKRPLVINTARGGLICEEDLAIALRSGQISGAGIDVTTPEPPRDDNVLFSLMDLPNFIFTPHVAWASQEAVQALADQLVGNIEAFIAGTPRNVVM
ncbi:D-2-hydroxyacid dehydrogenase [Paenalcaligenes sp. Me52]|uniref:D-2-hydroxyacid dehydrogenase n=1 Tax=Paenalcaligenes sp. Me52 TaxID=3392038 RepID=UPI003D266173